MSESREIVDVKKVKVKNFNVNPLFSKAKNSFSWKHFGQLIVENNGKRKYVFTDQVFCSKCLEAAQNLTPDSPFGCLKIKSYSTKVSTGNLIRHLKDDHMLTDAKNTATTSKNLSTFFEVSRPTRAAVEGSSKTLNKWTLARDLALWFCRSLIPFDSVANEGFEDFMKKYNVIYKKEDLPTRTTISREGLTDVYQAMLDNAIQDIKANVGTHAALTTDMWQDLYRRCSYITYTLQFITDNSSEMQNYTLATRIFEGKKTGEALSAYTQNIVCLFGLEEKSLTLVTDSGSNVRRISQILPEIKQHLCLGHGLHNLVTVDGIKNTPEIQNLVLKCKKVVKSLRYRLPEVEEEADKEQRRILTGIDDIYDHIEDDENFPLQQYEDTSDLLLSTDRHEESYFIDTDKSAKHTSVPSIKSATPTRWHSTLAMLQSLSSKFNRKPINTLLAKYGLSDIKFDEHEWGLIEDLTAFLSKFKRIVEVISSQTKCSINVALVFRSEIKDACETLDDNEKLVMLQLKRNMAKMLNHRFPITNLIVAAAMLDCRFCKLKEIDNYIESIQKTRVSFLTDYIKEIVPASELEDNGCVEHIDNRENSYLLELAQKHADADLNQEEHIEKECLKYLVSCDARDLLDGNVIKYWQDRKVAFPLLYKLAKAILSVPATSTPSERVFSVAGLTVTAKRSRLSPARVDKIIFIHDNYKNCKAAVN